MLNWMPLAVALGVVLALTACGGVGLRRTAVAADFPHELESGGAHLAFVRLAFGGPQNFDAPTDNTPLR